MASEFLSLSTLVEMLAGYEINYETLLKALRQTVIAETKKGFRDERDPDGVPWVPLKHPRRNSKGRDRILQDTGLLRTSTTARGGQNIDEMGPTYLEWGTSVDYGRFHQYGTRNMPARQFLGVGTDLEDAVTEQVADFVEAEIARLFE